MDRLVLNLDRYLPALLTQISNKWSRSSSRILLKRFGVGINEWRVMSLLAVEPRITAQRIAAVIGTDKAAVARSIQALADGGLATLEPNAADGRSRLVRLTAQGEALHDEIIQFALEREQRALASLSPSQVETLIQLLNAVRSNVAEMIEDE